MGKSSVDIFLLGAYESIIQEFTEFVKNSDEKFFYAFRTDKTDNYRTKYLVLKSNDTSYDWVLYLNNLISSNLTLTVDYSVLPKLYLNSVSVD